VRSRESGDEVMGMLKAVGMLFWACSEGSRTSVGGLGVSWRYQDRMSRRWYGLERKDLGRRDIGRLCM
jgi:hypothetical protein